MAEATRPECAHCERELPSIYVIDPEDGRAYCVGCATKLKIKGERHEH